jgi:hypothetical protein
MILETDENGRVIQPLAVQLNPKFVTDDVVTVTLAVEWTPPTGCIAARVPAACTYTLDGSAIPASLIAGSEVWISAGRKYTFDTTMNLEIMQ